jgi:Zn-ribbon protein, possibly nucleic acid-binding
MEQLEMLWLYQQEDMACDKLENEIKRSPTRVKLVKSRDYIVEQQNTIKRIETEVVEMADRVDVVQDALNRLDEQIKALEQKLEQVKPQNVEETRQLISEAKRITASVASYEAEMKKLKKDAGDRDHQQHDIRLKAARVKAEFDELKKVYDEEYKEKMAALEAQRAKAEAKAKGIAEEFMKEYRTIKSRCAQPMARLLGDQCGGCNMSQPSVVLRKIKAGSEIVECETCGRMIIQ